MKRWLLALSIACALGVAAACEGTETGNPDPSHEYGDAGALPDSDEEGGAPHHPDAGQEPPHDGGITIDAGGRHDAGTMDAGADEDAGQDEDPGR